MLYCFRTHDKPSLGTLLPAELNGKAPENKKPTFRWAPVMPISHREISSGRSHQLNMSILGDSIPIGCIFFIANGKKSQDKHVTIHISGETSPPLSLRGVSRRSNLRFEM